MNKASSSENSWNDCLYGLPEQIEAVTSRASLTVISAGAGTGKTETLAQRVAWLLADDPDCSVTDILADSVEGICDTLFSISNIFFTLFFFLFGIQKEDCL